MTDPAKVAAAAARASRRFRPHGGAVEVVGVDGGAVTVRFAGLCTGCSCRPQCLAATVEPELLPVPGVDRVEAVGVRLDAETRDRLADFLATPYDGRPG